MDKKKRKPEKQWMGLLTKIYNLNIGESLVIECSKEDVPLIRSGMSDPSRKAYHGVGAYKTKYRNGLLTIVRKGRGE